MTTLKPELAEFQSLKDLKPMLAAEGPCLSVYMQLKLASPTHLARQNALEWKETLGSLEGKVEQFGAQGSELLHSVSDWETVSQNPQPPGKSIAVFRSRDVFRSTWMDGKVASRASIEPRFHIRPLLAEVARGRVFDILGLSRKNVRMLRCTPRSSEEVPFPTGVITSFDAWMNTAQPNRIRDNRGTPGPGAGHSKGVFFGTDKESEDWAEHLTHFYKQIDRGVNEVLRDKKEPLMVAAVEYELPLYRSINSYPHLMEESIQGAPNGLKNTELHTRALDARERCYGKQIENKLDEWNHKVGGGASNRLKEVLTAAYDGRVVTLLVSDSLETIGVFDRTTHTARGRETGTSSDEDLVNDAAVQTILHSGQVLVVPNSKMPNGAPLAAIYRF
ncbi:MAG: hypothetical protein JOY54_01635 [Acidobacteriaceae bacterium]|nr:hypothetical protein [Acidobacteriaceae bacterium]